MTPAVRRFSLGCSISTHRDRSCSSGHIVTVGQLCCYLCVIALVTSMSQSALADDLADCADDRNVIAQPTPIYPSKDEASKYFGNSTRYLHTFVEGTVIVSIIVSASGDVEEIRVIDSMYHLVGPDRDKYDDCYFEDFHPANVIRTVKRWRFAPDYSVPTTPRWPAVWDSWGYCGTRRVTTRRRPHWWAVRSRSTAARSGRSIRRSPTSSTISGPSWRGPVTGPGRGRPWPARCDATRHRAGTGSGRRGP